MTYQKDIPNVANAQPTCDLVDFYNRWPSLRGSALSILDRSDLKADERDVLSWLMHLADRIGPEDLRGSD
ncbi:MAG: hypothetical protein P8P66_14820 [Paracoccaceae bacterium]|jgi:hypothetical protein|nr:hypothetical protein [Paracoccaceae bacterium]